MLAAKSSSAVAAIAAAAAACGPAATSTKPPPSASLPVGAPTWTQQLSGGGGGSAAADVVVAPDGAVYVVGTFRGTLASAGADPLASSGASDAAFVAKLAPTGDVAWTRRLGEGGAARGRAIALTGDRIVVAGTFSGSLSIGPTVVTAPASPDAFVASLSTAGDIAWATRIGGTGTTQLWDVTAATSGEIVAVGAFDDALAVGNRTVGAEGMQDGFAVALGPDGTSQWVRTFGDIGPDYLSAAAFTASGDVVVGGSFFGDLAIGEGLASVDDTQDAVVALLRGTTGEPVWARQLGADGTDSVHALAVAGAGSIYVLGTFDEPVAVGRDELSPAGSADVFVAHLDATGAPTWTRSLGGRGREFAGRLAVGANVVAVTGAFEGTGTFADRPLTSGGGLDGFVATFRHDGAPVWAARFGGAAHDDLGGVGITAAGDIVTAGGFDGQARFGPATVEAPGRRDVVVLRLTP